MKSKCEHKEFKEGYLKALDDVEKHIDNKNCCIVVVHKAFIEKLRSEAVKR